MFAFGTRLTRLTASSAHARPRAGAGGRGRRAVVDWSSGTRIGGFAQDLQRRVGAARRSRAARSCVIVSDGWERGDPSSSRREMARLARTAFAVVWVNPLKGHVDYEPLSAGMLAALPYVDRFLPGHDIASLEDLADSLAAIDRRHAA